MGTYTDALGRTLTIARPPERIVSLVPSITETLFAFGAGDRVAGVTRFCTEPKDAVRGKPRVGGTKDVDRERVLALRPDLVVANAEENTQADVQALMEAGLPVWVTYARTVRQAVDEMRDLASVIGASAAADAVLQSSEQALAEAGQDARPPVRVFCPVWRDPWMTVNRDTYIHDMLRLAGGRNVFADALDRYPVVTLEEAARRRPDVVLLPDEPYHFRRRHIPEVIGGLPSARIYLVDGKALCWYGPRIPEGIRAIRRAVRGENEVSHN